MPERIELQHKSKHNPLFPIRPVLRPIGPSIAYVELTQGQWALIDADDALRVGRYNWRAIKAGTSFYARRTHQHQGLHVFLVGLGADHINGNPLDNRRLANLRPASRSQNNCNRRRQRNNSSGYKGVSWHQGRQRWEAIIQANGKRKDLGGFSTPEAAYAAYCLAATKMHGEFARVA